jgi:hypothetical protein
VILQKASGPKDVVIAVLKRRLRDECDGHCIERIVEIINHFAASNQKEYSDELVEAWKTDFNAYLQAYGIENLKPLVAPYTLGFRRVIEMLTSVFKSLPTLGDYISKGIIEAKYYNPGQYKTRGVEEYARSLIIPWHYKKITGKAPLRILQVEDNKVKLGVKVKGKVEKTVELPKSMFIPAFRSYSNVVHVDITGEEDLAISSLDERIIEVLKRVGISDTLKVHRAVNDIKSAYSDLAGNMVLLRKFQIPSPGLYWLAFLSENRVLGTTDYINVKLNGLDLDRAKILVLYLNSMFTIAQVISLREETRGGWGRFDLIGMWDRIHIPDVVSLPKPLVKEGLELYEKVKERVVRPIDERLKFMSEEQVNIDLYASKLLNLDMTKDRLEEMYNAILNEMTILIGIMKAFREGDERKRKAHVEEKTRTKDTTPKLKTLDAFIKRE